MNDPIADMIARINNALMVGKLEVSMPLSKAKKSIADILKSEGFIEDVAVDTDRFGVLTLRLKYLEDQAPAITRFERVSKPGRRMYAPAGKLPFVLNDLGIAIVSTSQGLMTNKEARSKRVGGEIVCNVY